jgi:hypothetical protein
MWPQYILDNFARIPANTTIENKFYGVYNMILDRECFNTPQFAVEPQYALPNAQTPGVPTVDFVVTYVVEVNDGPVFFLEIKPPGHVEHIATRIDADEQMRSRFRSLFNLVPTPRLYGASVMGHRLAFYSVDKVTRAVIPGYVAPSTTHVMDTVPEARWDVDITTEEGYQRFMAIVQEIRQMVDAL